MELGFWIPKAVLRIQKPRIPDFTREFSRISDLGSHKQKIPGIWNPDSFTRGDRRENADILRF